MADNDRKLVFLHAFGGFSGGDEPLAMRCRGETDEPPTLECILFAGHAGVSLGSRFGPIYGFLPQTAGLDPAAVVQRLRSHDPAERSFPGEVGDHRPIFERAAEEAERRDDRSVITLEYSYPLEVADAVLKEIERQLEQTALKYSFPGPGGDCNCITWLSRIGLVVPDHYPPGQMKKLIMALEDKLTGEQPIFVDSLG